MNGKEAKPDGMLVLTRGVGQSLMIGDGGEIQVRVLGIQGGQIRIGVKAPKEVPVHREEVFARMRAEKEGGGSGGR